LIYYWLTIDLLLITIGYYIHGLLNVYVSCIPHFSLILLMCTLQSTTLTSISVWFISHFLHWNVC